MPLGPERFGGSLLGTQEAASWRRPGVRQEPQDRRKPRKGLLSPCVCIPASRSEARPIRAGRRESLDPQIRERLGLIPRASRSRHRCQLPDTSIGQAISTGNSWSPTAAGGLQALRAAARCGRRRRTCRKCWRDWRRILCWGIRSTSYLSGLDEHSSPPLWRGARGAGTMRRRAPQASSRVFARVAHRELMLSRSGTWRATRG